MSKPKTAKWSEHDNTIFLLQCLSTAVQNGGKIDFKGIASTQVPEPATTNAMYLRLSRIKRSAGFTDSTNWKYSGRENAAAAYAAATLTLGGHGGFGRGAKDGGADDAATTAWPEGIDPHPYAPTAPVSADKGEEDKEEDEEDEKAKDSVTKKRKFEEEMDDETEVNDIVAAAAADEQKTGQVQQEQDNENDDEKEVEGGEASPPQQEKEKKMKEGSKTNAEKEAEKEAKERKRKQQNAAGKMKAANKKLRRRVAATPPFRAIRYPPSPE